MAKRYATLAEQQIQELTKKVTEDVVLEEKRINAEQFKIICQNYLRMINQEIKNLQNRKNLIDRIQAIGGLMHGDVSSVQRILVLSHTFESALNNFLGRQVPITWVSSTGNIQIASQSTILSMYGSANLGLSAQHDLIKGASGRSYVGRIEGINNSIFQDKFLNPELQKLQQDLKRSSQNKRNVFKEAKKRYNNSINMSYASNPKTRSYVKNIYWRTEVDGSSLNFSGKISNPGYIGQGYVAMILHTKGDQLNSKITFPSSSKAPPYDLISEDYLRILANYALEGDVIPGIIQGDVKADENGNIQLAVKQGRNFSAASIAGNIAIAYAMLYNAQTKLLDPKNIREQLESINTTNWQAIFESLTGVLKKDIENIDLKVLFNI